MASVVPVANTITVKYLLLVLHLNLSGFNDKPFCFNAGSVSATSEEHFSIQCFLPMNVLAHPSQVAAQAFFDKLNRLSYFTLSL